MKKYISVNEPVECGDVWSYVWDTAQDATDDAQRMWERLTPREQAWRHCYSAVVYDEDCEVDEDGNIDWYSSPHLYNYPDSFDSNVWYAVIYSEYYEWDDGSHILSKAVDLAEEIGFTGTNSGEIEVAQIDVTKSFCDGVYYIDSDGRIEFKS